MNGERRRKNGEEKRRTGEEKRRNGEEERRNGEEERDDEEAAHSAILSTSPRAPVLTMPTKSVAANEHMAAFCFDSLIAHFNGSDLHPPAFEGGHFPLFVSWKAMSRGGDQRLRGCIGSLEARCILSGFKDYALISALKDRRFAPIQAREVPSLVVTVSLLTNYESAAHFLDWEIGKHGMILEFTDLHNLRRSATYLPDVIIQEGWSKIEAIDSLIRKAGYSGPITDTLRRRSRITRYQSSFCSMTYNEYVRHVETTRNARVPILVS